MQGLNKKKLSMEKSPSLEQATRGREQARKRSSSGSTWILLGMLMVGIAILAYPTVSNWWNAFHSSRIIYNYAEVVERFSKDELDAMRAEAVEYNRRLADKPNILPLTDEEKAEYESLLNLDGDGVMGYVQIPSINVDIPIYHGTEDTVLQKAVGHIDWTSLPVGGKGTHCVISGHRGLPRAKLFSDLDELREGDTFTLTVLNQRITYEVDQIRIVEPKQLSELSIVPGEDYCTLVTCTPYGINTHRMLVRGHRVGSGDGSDIVISPEAYQLPSYITIPLMTVPLLILALIMLGMVSLVRGRRQKRRNRVLRNLQNGKF